MGNGEEEENEGIVTDRQKKEQADTKKQTQEKKRCYGGKKRNQMNKASNRELNSKCRYRYSKYAFSCSQGQTTGGVVQEGGSINPLTSFSACCLARLDKLLTMRAVPTLTLHPADRARANRSHISCNRRNLLCS